MNQKLQILISLLGLVFLTNILSAQNHSNSVKSGWMDCFRKAQWMVTEQGDSTQPGSWHNFRKTFELTSMPDSSLLKIAVDTKYWMWINDSLVVYEGGLKRGPNPNDTYFDEIDIAKHLKSGKNTIAVLVWYWGGNGFSHNSSGKCGLWLEGKAGDVSLNSGKSWKAMKNPAYSKGTRPNPNFRLSEPNIAYDAQKEMEGWQRKAFDDTNWPNALEAGESTAKPWNQLVKRPIPFFRNYGIKSYSSIEQKGDTFICKLPHNGQFSPIMKVKAKSGKKIFIASDTYYLGALSPTDSLYTLCSDYLTREGIQEYESYGWLSGHEIRYVIPKEVEVIELNYRETGYDTGFAGSFECSDPLLNTLWQKSQRSVYVNMRDNFSDCPDRERAQWTGDAAIEMEQTFYAFDPNSWLLSRKLYHDMVNWQRSDSIIVCPIPENEPRYKKELPAHSLMPFYYSWKYFTFTHDTATMRYIYEPVKKYLAVWKINENGSLVYRPGGWDWGDWGENIDFVLIQHGWYLLTTQTMANIASLLGKPDEAAHFRQIATQMTAYLNSPDCWNGSEYRHKNNQKLTDDRANALMVISGVADSSKFEKVSKVFQQQFHSSPWMEKFVLESLIKMGRQGESLARMKKRFQEMAESKFSTLWEIWNYDTTPGAEHGNSGYNHGWGGCPLILLSQHYAGITPFEGTANTYTIAPKLSGLEWIKTRFPVPGGAFDLSISEDRARVLLNLTTPRNYQALLFVPLKNVSGKITCNGQLLYEGGSGKTNTLNIKFAGKADNQVCFLVPEGKFVVESTAW